MPCDYKKYPKNWHTEIRPRILKRANNKCEWCGAENYKPHPKTGSKVILTISHFDHDKDNNSDNNLNALCQKCHLGHDLPRHIQNRLRNAKEKLVEAGQLELALN